MSDYSIYVGICTGAILFTIALGAWLAMHPEVEDHE